MKGWKALENLRETEMERRLAESDPTINVFFGGYTGKINLENMEYIGSGEECYSRWRLPSGRSVRIQSLPGGDYFFGVEMGSREERAREKARETGEDTIFSRWPSVCTEPNPEKKCAYDIIVECITPAGEKEKKRLHTKRGM